MFIAVNANKRPAPFGGADAQVAIYPSRQSPLLRTEQGGILLFQNYEHLAPTGRRQAVIRHLRRATGLSQSGYVRVVACRRLRLA